jgi:uncharacterized protein (DUF433 family)
MRQISMFATPIPTNVIDLDQYIENRLMSDRPHIKGRRVDIASVVALADIMPVLQVAEELTLTAEQVLAALMYYEQHRQEIDAQEEEDAIFFDIQFQKQAKKPR